MAGELKVVRSPGGGWLGAPVWLKATAPPMWAYSVDEAKRLSHTDAVAVVASLVANKHVVIERAP